MKVQILKKVNWTLKKLAKISLLLLILLSTSKSLMSQDKAMEIKIKGKTYQLTGDNLTIVIGKNLKLNITREVPENVRKSIAQRYEGELKELESAYNSGKISLAELSKKKQNAYTKFEVAYATATKLAEEFARVSFSQESFLFRLAYVVYREGDIDGALDILNEDSLEMNETCQAMQYLLVIAANWLSNNRNAAFLLLEQVVKKYPSFNTLSSYGDYMQMQQNYVQAIALYEKALGFTSRVNDKNYTGIQIAFCYLHTNQFEEANKYISSLKFDVISEVGVNEVSRDCYFPAPLSTNFKQNHSLKRVAVDKLLAALPNADELVKKYGSLFSFFLNPPPVIPH